MSSSAPANPSSGWCQWLLAEVGIRALYRTHRTVKLLCLQRFVRFFGYGLSTLILASFLSRVGISDARIGQFMTLTLVGDLLISFLLALVADALSRRLVLGVGSLLMTVAGVVFAFAGNFWILLLGAIVGVISPNGNEIGPFRAVEESSLAHLTSPAERGQILAWYLLSGSAGSALGMMTCGWAVESLQHLPDWDILKAYRTIFIIYAACGIVKFFLTLSMDPKIEIEETKQQQRQQRQQDESHQGPGDARTDVVDETRPLLDRPGPRPLRKSRLSSLRDFLPSVQRSSVSIVISLCLFFCLDSFASGMASASWVTYFFRKRYHVEESSLGTLFFVANIVTAVSMLAASSVAKRIGNIKAMAFTHFPSTIFLALIAVPSDVRLSKLFLLLRACTQSMDAGPRAAFVAAVLLPSERTAILGTINLVKTLGTSLGPLVTGVLAGRDLFWVAFLCAGALKAVYDLGMLATFVGHKTVAEREAQDAAAHDAEE